MLTVNSQTQHHEDINYLVVGLGLTGYSVACYLLSHGYRCRVQDSRDIPPYYQKLKARFNDVQITSQQPDAELTDWADALVVSPGLSIHQPYIQQAADLGKRIIGDIELFAQAVEKPVIAITGSNGKSTVATLLGEMISADGMAVGVGGNIGVPALDLLEEDFDYYVLELSSYQLETTSSLSPVAATVLNLSEDHLDRYVDYAAYVQAKLHIYDSAKTCVSNFDDEATRHNSTDTQFSLNSLDAEFSLVESDGQYLAKSAECWLAVTELKVSGQHNWANCLAAMALAESINVSRPAIISALKNFSGIAHRSQWVADIDGVEWVNDSKATNVGAAMASIKGRSNPVILIAGGQSKNADMSVMQPVLQQHVKQVLLMGEDAGRIEQAWHGVVAIERVDNMQQAVTRASQIGESGDCVLLAPACASFDMYAKFEARGDDFTQCVKGLDHG
ncbi:MAG: UDP-N-acetylmuramoyl-L-alanine--D-glutamate ligase [Gammaproteobacteria bacterium]|nr:UDP-N-acetylmuramoyl-L-alanine--D-glutamate ligase [Gammaproteobacteria bacterium]